MNNTDPLKVGFGCGKRVDSALADLIDAAQDAHLSTNPTESYKAFLQLAKAFARLLRLLPFSRGRGRDLDALSSAYLRAAGGLHHRAQLCYYDESIGK